MVVQLVLLQLAAAQQFYCYNLHHGNLRRWCSLCRGNLWRCYNLCYFNLRGHCNSHQCSIAMVGDVALLYNNGEWHRRNLFFFSIQQLQEFGVFVRERKKKNEKERKKKRALKPIPEYVTPRLVSLFSAPPILALLVGRNVTTQVPSNMRNTNSNNTNIKKKFKNSKQKKFLTFNIK